MVSKSEFGKSLLGYKGLIINRFMLWRYWVRFRGIFPEASEFLKEYVAERIATVFGSIKFIVLSRNCIFFEVIQSPAKSWFGNCKEYN